MLMILLSYVAGCSTPEPPPTPAPVTEPAEMQPAPKETEAAKTNHFEAIGIGFLEEPDRSPEKQNLQTKEFIEAQGFGFPSPNAVSSIQKQLTATEAAQYRALAKLVEKQKGLEVIREARAVDMAFAEEEVSVTLSGSLMGVSEVSRNYDAETEMATVTMRMALEPEEKPRKPLSLEHRKVQAETAARIHATALLRGQIGQSFVEQDIRIKNLTLDHQEARILVEGYLEGIQFSDIRWISETICEVTATLEISEEKMGEQETIP